MNPQLWQPSKERIENSQMSKFCEFVNQHYSLKLTNYHELYDWSIQNISEFWEAIWEFTNVIHSADFTQIIDDLLKMPGAKWFSNAKLNYAENLLKYRDDRIAIQFYGEDSIRRTLTYSELYEQVEKLAFALKSVGVEKGDRVAGFMPNLPETIIAMLATSSIGAIWSSSSPDFGIKGVLDRFSQISPKVIFATEGYFYKGKRFDSLQKLKEILNQLPSVEKVVITEYTQKANLSDFANATTWDEFLPQNAHKLEFEQLPFGHPLYVMYSSGTTGKPKSIVHSAGGTLIQHLKELVLHTDLKRDDTIFYFTTCGWMMWNWLVSGLAVGCTIVLYDGNPFYPNPEALLKMADELNITIFGTSAKYIASLESAGVKPNKVSDFSKLKTILSTGSPLSEDSFEYVYRDWKSDVQLSSIAGGTDIVSCFMLGNPTLPVYKGEIQCRGLGMKVESFNELGETVFEKKAELVCTAPFPSMPIYFWNDNDGRKYHNAYFDVYTNIWRHGDYVVITENGGVQMFGRSDATLNPGGVRIGTSEIYRIVENISEISDSVVAGQNWENDERVILFVKLNDSAVLDDNLKNEIIVNIRKGCSPRHIPAKIIEVEDIPYTINGKKVEVAVKKIIHGEDVANREALANPKALDCFKNLDELKAKSKSI
ncbi:MAG: acetoacetate--CoA ligase [Candidatus Marinimicrobia bacterium]|nr:acetoacetate--CoA ligase [Candidatus Neomarinimicrobiota bacterium]MBL7023642.1 acetoacetate--CoA ligase [Candidatus Neomarinimicrobiota bacterium]MBL7109794.1 acetoacetate--CoA ligase [Candidatus Neomarinimicrobiota bacterium]